MTARSYCVVGGGISGLTAAYRLRAAAGADATITLFDPADRFDEFVDLVFSRFSA